MTNEFDLRPFEIKKPKVYYYKVWIREPDSHSVTGLWGNYGLFNSLSDAEQILERTFQFLGGKEHSYQKDKVWIERCEDIVKSSAYEWKWEDIKIGWFFKGNPEHKLQPIEIHLKTSPDKYATFYDYRPHSRFASWKLLNYHPDAPDKFDIIITNVYDCPELSKMLMIEKVTT